MVSWLEHVDPSKVHEDRDYTANGEFAKLMRISATDDLGLGLGGQCHVHAITERLEEIHFCVEVILFPMGGCAVGWAETFWAHTEDDVALQTRQERFFHKSGQQEAMGA